MAVSQWRNATNSEKKAIKAKEIATAQQIAAQGELLVQTGNKEEAGKGALLIIEALRRAPDQFTIQRAFASAISYFPPLTNELQYDGVSSKSWAIDFSSDGKYFAAIEQDRVPKIWNIHTGKLVSKLSGDEWLRTVLFINDDRVLATTGEKNKLGFWTVQDGNNFKFIDTEEPIRFLAYNKKENLLALSKDRQTEVWVDIISLSRDKTQYQLKQVVGDVVALDFSSKNNFLVTVAYHPQIEENVTQIWDFKTDQRIGSRENYLDATAVAFSHDGKMVAATGLSEIEIWKLEYDKESDRYSRLMLGKLKGLRGIWSVTFSPDDKLVAIGAEDSIHLWDFRSQREVATFQHKNTIKLKFVANGKYLASANNTSMRLWDFNRGQVLNSTLTNSKKSQAYGKLIEEIPKLCQRINRKLSADEWREFFSGQDIVQACTLFRLPDSKN